MRYINTRTQAVIETVCELKGGDWVKVEANQPGKNTKTTVPKPTQKKRGG